MTVWFRTWFLFSSFGPLYAIFATRLYWINEAALAALFGLLAISALAVFIKIRRLLLSNNASIIEISDVKAKDNEIFPYLMSYIPPLILRDLSDPGFAIPLAILYFIIAIAFIRLDSPYINPFFILFGYRIYEAKTPNKTVITVIAKGRRLSGGELVPLHEVGAGDLYYCE